MGMFLLVLIGGFWLLYLFGFNLLVVGIVGFFVFVGVVVEFGVIMFFYLK